MIVTEDVNISARVHDSGSDAPRGNGGMPNRIAERCRTETKRRVAAGHYEAGDLRGDWKPLDLSAPEFHVVKYRISLSLPDAAVESFDGQVQLTLQPLKDAFQLVSLASGGLAAGNVGWSCRGGGALVLAAEPQPTRAMPPNTHPRAEHPKGKASL